MFKSGDAQGDLNGFLDAGSQLEGELRFEDTFRVDGKIKGKVTSSGDLVVGQGGHIEGEIKVGGIFVSGTVKGQLEAARRVEIARTGKVFGDLVTPSLVVEDGAFFEGQCGMVRGDKQAGKSRAEEKVLRPIPVKQS